MQLVERGGQRRHQLVVALQRAVSDLGLRHLHVGAEERDMRVENRREDHRVHVVVK